MNIRGILLAAIGAAVVTAAAAAAAPSGQAAAATTGHAAGGSALAGHPRPLEFNLHAQFTRLRGHTRMGPRAGVVPPRGRRLPAGRAASRLGTASCAEPNCSLIYEGGLVQHAPRVYVVFWGPTWQSSAGEGAAAGYLLSLFSGLGTSSDTWSLITSEYGDSTGRPAFGAQELVNSGYDTSAPPDPVQPSDLAAEASASARRFGITDLANAQVIVVAQAGTCFSDGFAGSCGKVQPQGSYCGWHSATPVGGTEMPFVNLPYQLDAGYECGQNWINSGSAGTYDGFSAVGGHEYAEAITDPLPSSGWYDPDDGISGGEIADKCAWGGQPYGTSDPYGDITLGGSKFAMQSLWNNATGSCVMSGFSVTPLGNQVTSLGKPVSLQVRATSTPPVTLSYAATGLPTGLSIGSSTGLIQGTVTGSIASYTPTVTVSSSSAGSRSFSFNWQAVMTGPVTGTWSKCVDDAGGRTTGGNKIEIWTCTGGAPQKISLNASGQLLVEGGCVTGGLVVVFYEPCSGATNKTWTHLANGEYVNKSSGLCLTDPANSKTDGTQLTVAGCLNTVYQHWSLP